MTSPALPCQPPPADNIKPGWWHIRPARPAWSGPGLGRDGEIGSRVQWTEWHYWTAVNNKQFIGPHRTPGLPVVEYILSVCECTWSFFVEKYTNLMISLLIPRLDYLLSESNASGKTGACSLTLNPILQWTSSLGRERIRSGISLTFLRKPPLLPNFKRI